MFLRKPDIVEKASSTWKVTQHRFEHELWIILNCFQPINFVMVLGQSQNIEYANKLLPITMKPKSEMNQEEYGQY